MAFCWCANDGLTLNAGLVALWFFRGSGPVLLRNPIFLWFFRGGSGPPVHLSGSVHDPDQVKQNCLKLMVPSTELILENKLTDSQHARVITHCLLSVVCSQQEDWTQIRPSKMSGLIWIQSVWLSDVTPERIFRKSLFWKQIRERQKKKHEKFSQGAKS